MDQVLRYTVLCGSGSGSGWVGPSILILHLTIFFILVNKKKMKMVRLFRKLAHIARTEFQTRSLFFYVCVCYIKNKIQQSINWSKILQQKLNSVSAFENYNVCVYLQIAGDWTEFKTRSRHLVPSFKLSPSILLLYSTPSTFLLHLPSANYLFKIVIVTVARAFNWKFIFR
jgi:hypothetical protein